MSKIFIGIDPGLTGAVAGISSSGKFLFCFDIPTIEKKTTAKIGTKAKVKRKVDGLELYKLLLSSCDLDVSDVVLTLEAQSAMPPASGERSMGSASLMSLGHTFGVIEAAVQIAEIKYRTITPRAWKGFYKIPGEKKGGKKIALSVARMLFRSAPKDVLKLQKHHNRAEALLLAKYGFDLS